MGTYRIKEEEWNRAKASVIALWQAGLQVAERVTSNDFINLLEWWEHEGNRNNAFCVTFGGCQDCPLKTEDDNHCHGIVSKIMDVMDRFDKSPELFSEKMTITKLKFIDYAKELLVVINNIQYDDVKNIELGQKYEARYLV